MERENSVLSKRVENFFISVFLLVSKIGFVLQIPKACHPARNRGNKMLKTNTCQNSSVPVYAGMHACKEFQAMNKAKISAKKIL